MKLEEAAGAGGVHGGDPACIKIEPVIGSVGRTSSAGRQVTGDEGGPTGDALNRFSESFCAQLGDGDPVLHQSCSGTAMIASLYLSSGAMSESFCT
ncbi:unnamed protein product [Urochloa humidicola]